ncbi:hypothetical protein ANME2D_02185 [Candidatus Methanoperedens nitroreducens]|uniref:Phage metallopeptidase domain-containing protein n=2 Tax=Candidatus Methanoperedens nitratireducens TaxID=1392998 RepID=A0A062V7X9_9EURY|nr:hypothetical protein ANME2D_02185 [Candidatus Methanoperedens nitroreducens]
MLPVDSDKNRSAGFDFTGSMTLLVEDIVKTHPSFCHIRPENILIAISHSNGSDHGVIAKLRPLRFEGSPRIYRRILHPDININGNDILYVVYFCLPRYLNHGAFEDKLATVLHELYHISPLFNGDIRRFEGKNYAHGNSKEEYNKLINMYADEYINSTCRPELSMFLESRCSDLKSRYGAVYGDMIRISRPKPLIYSRRV